MDKPGAWEIIDVSLWADEEEDERVIPVGLKTYILLQEGLVTSISNSFSCLICLRILDNREKEAKAYRRPISQGYNSPIAFSAGFVTEKENVGLCILLSWEKTALGNSPFFFFLNQVVEHELVQSPFHRALLLPI